MKNNCFNQKLNHLFFLPCIGLIVCILTSACHHLSPDANTQQLLQGYVVETQALDNATVTLIDADGKVLVTKSDVNGRYSFSLAAVKAPLLLSATLGGKEVDCLRNDILRPVCLASWIENLGAQKIQFANINPLTDKLVSDIAVAKGFIGPQQWIESRAIGDYKHEWLAQAIDNQNKGFENALQQLDLLQGEKFNAVTYSPDEHKKALRLFALLHHNRNYDNNTGETGHTTLSDAGFRPLVGLFATGGYEEFNLKQAELSANKIANATRRIFIVGDSTSAMYEPLRYPRQGWGQALAEKYNARNDIAIVVGSRAGRSSRDFYNGRWFAQMEPLIKPGDFVLIAHGHNDQNCDSAKAIRGLADVKNLCTYPNNKKGEPQFPQDKPDMSFQRSLENYIAIARNKSAFPIMITPTTRIKNAQGLQQAPVEHSHFTKQKPTSEFLFVGDYTQTIKDVATKNRIPVIDLELASIHFANQAGEPGWKNFWLVVDPKINSFYANNVAGSVQLPDGTHFQAAGAQAMTKMLIELISKNPELKDLQKYLN